MNSLELLDIIRSGETSTVQFKQRLDSYDKFAAEMIAMANTKGGVILIGVEDKSGKIVGLNYDDLRTTGNLIATISTDFIKPQIFHTTEVVSVETEEEVKKVLVIHIKEGISKPYKDRNGTIWLKQGGDKRKLTDNNEQVRLFQQSGLIYIDEMIVPYTSVKDVDKDKVQEYLLKIDDSDIDVAEDQLYRNLLILKDEHMTLGGLLFFAKNPQQYRPAFIIKAVSFFGNDISGSDYRGSKDIVGTVPEMFEQAMGFLNTYLEHKQKNQNFNTTGILEISSIALEELLQNALTHRDYSKNAPVKILIFDNRVEIISPGSLPNNLSIENIKMGSTVVRNNLVMTFASKLMKYRGIGSGIRRALKEHPATDLINDIDSEQFVAILKRG